MAQAFSFGELSYNPFQSHTKRKLAEKSQLSSVHLYHQKPLSLTGEQAPPHILFVLGFPPLASLFRAFKIWVSSLLPSTYEYDIVTATKLRVSLEEIKREGIVKFYKNFRASFLEYIQPGRTVIVSSGVAIEAITFSPDITPHCFYDFIFNKTFFYSPYTGTYIFPIDDLESIFKPILKNKVSTGAGYIPQKSSRRFFAEMQIRKIVENYHTLKTPPTPLRLKLQVLKTEKDVQAFLQQHRKDNVKMALDLETDGFNFVTGKIGCLTCSFDGITGYYLPYNFFKSDFSLAREFLATKQIIGQNIKFDAKFLQRQGFVLNIISDTLLLGQTLNEDRSNGLKALAYYYTMYGGYDQPLVDFIEKYHPPTYLDIPETLLAEYAIKDAIINFQAEKQMQLQLTELDAKFPPPDKDYYTFRDYYEKIKIPALRSFLHIEDRGVYVNLEVWEQNALEVENQLQEVKRELSRKLHISELLPQSQQLVPLTGPSTKDLFNDLIEEEPIINEDENEDDIQEKTLQSPQKLGQMLEKLGWSNQGRTKAGYYLTGEEQLLNWEKLEKREEATLLKKFRAYRTLQKTFLGKPKEFTEGWKKHVWFHKEDGTYRIHPTYRVMGTKSGRNACTDPNFQQLPTTSLGADLIKQIITVPNPAEYYLLTMDYSSLQMRLAAIDSEDPTLYPAYLQDPQLDIHSKTAYNIFIKNQLFDIEEIDIETEEGRKITVFPDTLIKIKRDGKIITLPAEQLKETDHLLEVINGS